MLGLFGTLNLATRALSTQREGTEVAGHNLANVNNPAYARQRLAISTSIAIPTALGPQGTGVESLAITQIRNELLDRQILSETSVHGSLSAQQRALEYAQANLGQVIDRHASGASGSAAAGGVGGEQGLAEDLSGLFNAFQGLSTNPTSTAERQVLLLKAQDLTTRLNQVDSRMADVNGHLNRSVESDVNAVNLAIADVAKLNAQIIRLEAGGGTANDLRDLRNQRLEQLGELVDFTIAEQPSGSLDVVMGGVAMTAGSEVLEQLETYDPGGGQLLLRTRSSGTAIMPTGGSLHGTIDVRDGALATLRGDINTLAAELITQVNSVHSAGFGLGGTTGESFFTGTDAASIAVNPVLLADPARIQASGVAGATGDNQTVLALAQLAEKPVAGLGNQTFTQSYGETVARAGQSLASVTAQLDSQNKVRQMLLRQRDSVSGVSLDEEMTDLIRFQKAFEASARLITVVDEMLDTVLNMKR
jgi:flagellar hook-associated protein 1 FlgK